MPVYKSNDGTWKVVYCHRVWPDKLKQTTKRGFKTKREALEFEKEATLKDHMDLEIPLGAFTEMYLSDIESQIRESTLVTKRNVIEKHILPYLGSKQMCQITNRDVMKWQNEVKMQHTKYGKPFSTTYLKTINNQLSAIFSHAVKYYNLKENPVAKTTRMGTRRGAEMKIWTVEEYKSFLEAVADKPLSYYAFEILYWCGLRSGELLALTKQDINLSRGTISITKTFQKINQREVTTPPKTAKGNRMIAMPDFLCKEIGDFLNMQSMLADTDRLFPVTKHYLKHEMARGCKVSGVREIRIHDLRHSHVSLLIDMGFSAVAIGDRVGHESASITYQYAHLFPSTQKDMATGLNILNEEDDDDE